MPHPPIALQTGVLHKKYKFDTDADLILDRLKALRYEGIEAGTNAPPDLKKKLDDRGLKYAAAHVAISGKPDVAKLIEFLHAMDGRDVCNSGILEWKEPGLDHFCEGIKALNDLGGQLKREGIRLHYHNHAFEFNPIDGSKTGMDFLLEGLDPDAVDLCVDVAWVWRAKVDPADFLRRHKDRVGYLHFKDTDETDWHELGKGKLDWHAIMQVLPELKNVTWNAIEQDSTKIDPLESIAISREYLKKTFNY